MCIGGSPSYAVPQRQEAAFKDAPPVVTGSQIGVEKPKDTKKATEELKIRRQKKEGTYVDPNLSRTEELLTKRSGNKRVIRRVNGKLTSMTRNKYRSTLRSKSRKSNTSSSSGSTTTSGVSRSRNKRGSGKR